MLPAYQHLIPALWVAWGAYWWVSARGAKAVARRESIGSRLVHVVPLACAVLLVGLPRIPMAFLEERFLPLATSWLWIGAALTLAGLLFTVWARVHLGGNWSGIVTVKEDHELVTSGPYALVRHPIYSGLLLAFIGSTMARGEWRGILAVLLVLAAFWRKMLLEERWMREEFGDRYQRYCERVAPLVPYLH